jgi:lipopolysaccharide transport system permease protein
MMTDTLYTAEPALRHPARFFADAAADLRRAPAVAWRLFVSNMQSRHRRAWLGYLWLLLPTLGTTAVWVYVQSRRIVDIGATPIPYPVYVLAGTVFWQLFVDALNAPLQQLVAGRQMIARTRIPHEALILAGVFEAMLNCLVRMIVLAVVLMLFQIPIASTALLIPFGLLALAVAGLALGLAVAPLGMLYDDVGRALTLVTGFWFFLTPVIYPARPSGLLRFNPVTPLLETTRGLLTGEGTSGAWLPITAVAVALLGITWVLQRLARPHVVARLG